MISQPAFAQLDLSELLPDLNRLEAQLADMIGDTSFIGQPPVPQQDVPPQPNEKLRTLILGGMEVLRHVADGQSTKEIAHQLGMSFKTAVCHRYRMMEKLGVHDAVSLTRFAVRAGLVKL
jgi:DNA-binding NarL/FixJ family response regulator